MEKKDNSYNSSEKTIAMIKPDGVQRNLIGKVLDIYEQTGLQITNLKMTRLSRELAELHYTEHKGKDFFEELIQYITSGPVVIIELEGVNAVKRIRDINEEVRREYAVSRTQNTVHGSDSVEHAQREIDNFFK